jgi:hypothetical protein
VKAFLYIHITLTVIEVRVCVCVRVSVCVCLCTYMHRFMYTNIHTHPPAPAPSFLSWPALTIKRPVLRNTEAIAKGAQTRKDGARHDKASQRPKQDAQKVREDSEHLDRHPFFAELENARTRALGKVEGKEGRKGKKRGCTSLYKSTNTDSSVLQAAEQVRGGPTLM